MPLNKGGRMAEKEETITVAARLPESQVMFMRAYVNANSNEVRNMSDMVRMIVAEWMRDNA